MPNQLWNASAEAGESGESSESSHSSGSSSFVAPESNPRNDRLSSFRRRGIRKNPFGRHSSNSSDNGKGKSRRSRSELERLASRQVLRLHKVVSKRCPLLLNRACNVFLFVALLLWMITALSSTSRKRSIRYSTEAWNPDSKPHSLRKPLPKQPSLLDSAFNSLTGRQKRKKRKEDDSPGCVRPDWHSSTYPTCNDAHEIDLRKIILQGMREDPKQVGYVNSGLWRSVIAVKTRDEKELAVVKMMKTKHDLTPRNFDRHRRDAIVMERLQGDPSVVDIYGFCGNTVLTEYASRTVDDVKYDGKDGSVPGKEVVTRQTPDGRLKLAIGVMKGLVALHEVEGGPIVHADITAKQYLISDTGEIKVNDFNRCRFMAHYKKDGSPCKFIIPTAPGKNRSPEEYKEHDLDEKLDVYSAGNILYGILTGTKAWYSNGFEETKKYVKRGTMPKIPKDLRIPNTLDAALANLTELALENDPEKRMSARQMVKELEELGTQYHIKVP